MIFAVTRAQSSAARAFTKPRASLVYTCNHVQDDARRVSREHRDVVTSIPRSAETEKVQCSMPARDALRLSIAEQVLFIFVHFNFREQRSEHGSSRLTI